VDAGCRNLTAPWVRDKAQSDPSVELCGYFEDLENAGPEVSFPLPAPASRPVATLPPVRQPCCCVRCTLRGRSGTIWQ
jgi:hypothetical protein